MPNRTLPLNAIDAFLVTARHLNLTHAAKELCLTQGAVSRKIASLETWFGFPLFERHARGCGYRLRAAPCYRNYVRRLSICKPLPHRRGHNKRSYV